MLRAQWEGGDYYGYALWKRSGRGHEEANRGEEEIQDANKDVQEDCAEERV